VINKRFSKITFGKGDRHKNKPVKAMDSEFVYNLPNFTEISKKFKNITFGIGKRSEQAIKTIGPGPIYNLPSFTDKFTK
jgi:hypothetical protein